MNSNNNIQEIELEIVKTKNQVEVVILNVIERGEKLENLEEKALVLVSSASMFNKTAKKVERKMCCEKWKNILLIGILVLCILIFIIALLYSGFK